MPFPFPLSFHRLALWCLLAAGLFLTAAHGKETASPDVALREAWQLLYQGEFDIALRRFHSVGEATAPGSPQRCEALYGQAHCWTNRTGGRDLDRARELYRTLLSESPPQSPLRPWCELELAQIAHYFTPLEERDYAAIVQGYLSVHEAHPHSPAGEEAFLSAWLLKKAALNEKPQTVIDAALAFLQTHPQTPLRGQVLTLVANSYRDENDIQTCLKYLIEAYQARASLNPAFDYSTFLWQIASLAEFELGDLRLARTYYEQLIRDYPRDTRVFPARQALKRIDAIIDAVRRGKTPPQFTNRGEKG